MHNTAAEEIIPQQWTFHLLKSQLGAQEMKTRQAFQAKRCTLIAYTFQNSEKLYLLRNPPYAVNNNDGIT